MLGAATLGINQFGQKLRHSASALKHEANMSLRRNAPHIEPLLDQAKFLQASAQRQRDKPAFRNPAKGYLFPVGKFHLLDATRYEFHREPFLSAISGGAGAEGGRTKDRGLPGQGLPLNLLRCRSGKAPARN
jgi:hypothetical protein